MLLLIMMMTMMMIKLDGRFISRIKGEAFELTHCILETPKTDSLANREAPGEMYLIKKTV